MKPTPQSGLRGFIQKAFPILLFLASLIVFWRAVLIPAAQEVTHGYMGYYAASYLFVTGQWGPQVYDDEWMNQKTYDLTGGKIREVISPNIPTMSFLMLPLARLSPEAARPFWIFGNVGVLFLGLGYVLANRSLASWHWLWLGFAVLFPPLIMTFSIGQAMIIVFFLLALALYGIEQGRSQLAGVALGAAFAFKLYGVSLWIIPLLRKDWKTFWWMAGTFLILAGATLPWVGWESWLTALSSLNSLPQADFRGVTAYQNIFSFFSHLFREVPIWNPDPILHLPILATSLPILGAVVALLLTVWKGKNAPLPLIVSALLPLNILLIPNALEHHFTLFLIPIFFLLDDLDRKPPPQGLRTLDWGLLLGGMVLLCLPVYYKHPALAGGWLALLAYPRLYGGWLIWGAAMVRIKNYVS